MERKPQSDTSWQKVADWYDDLLETDENSYQAKVISPNILRLMDIKSGERILDVACGQGYFSRQFASAGAQVTGIDLSKDLIDIAKKHTQKGIEYFVAPADNMNMIQSDSYDKTAIILALQNIKMAAETLGEISRILKVGGKLWIVLNHPVFRIPKHSGWEFDVKAGKQYRSIDAYMSESESSIDMHPGKKDSVKTFSFHRPLQWYFKVFQKAGFSVTRLEEWISHKDSQKGPRKAEEDRLRKEIPLFMCVEMRKI